MWSNFRKFEDAAGTPAVGGGEWASDVEASDEQLTSAAHIFLPLASIVVSLVFPPTWVALGVAALIELGDAALYMTVDEDPYAAGLAAIFAFVPFAQLKFLPSLYKLGKEGVIRFIKKLGLGKIDDLIKEERQLYNEMVENYEKLSRMAKLNMAKKLTYLTLKSAKTAKDYISFLQKLVSKGLLEPESLGITGLLVGGTFYSWDALAKQMDLCNPAPLKMLTASDWAILRKVGEAGNYVQPFTTSCEVDAIIDKLNSIKTDNGLFTELLTQAKDKNYILGKKYSSSFSTDVLILQYILKKGGYEKSIKQPYYSIKESKEKTTVLINNASIIKKVAFYTSTGTLLKSVDNKENDTLTISLAITKGVVIMKMSTVFGDEVRKFVLGTGLSNKIYNTSSTAIEPNYGYFDSITEYLVKIYQKKNGLNSDGVVGNDTLNKLISDLKSKKYGTIPNYDSFDFDKIRVDLIRKEYDKYVKEKDQLLLDDKKIEEAYKKHQSLVDQESKKISDGIKETNNLTDEEFEDIFGKYVPK
jgi:peptidoglycan hydrolase-like protein with peptidoglycan-binding domain